MTSLSYQRFTITIPQNMAQQIAQVCMDEGRNRSELFREAFRLYLANGQAAKPVSPPPQATLQQVYERVTSESEKDRLLEQWAQMIETAPDFEDIRAVSGAVGNIAGESLL